MTTMIVFVVIIIHARSRGEGFFACMQPSNRLELGLLCVLARARARSKVA